jgi:glycosyltransferase involved in cell wall biosynthesis
LRIELKVDQPPRRKGIAAQACRERDGAEYDHGGAPNDSRSDRLDVRQTSHPVVCAIVAWESSGALVNLQGVRGANSTIFVKAFQGRPGANLVKLQRIGEDGKNTQLRPIRVPHYMGTNFGMTGVETFILQLCAAQKRSGLVPSIAIDLNSREEVRTIAAMHGIEVHDLPASESVDGKLGKLAKVSSRIRSTQALWRRLRDSDVIHIHAVGISCIEGFIARGLSNNKALIVTHHATLGWFAAHRNLISDLTFWMEKRLVSRVIMPYRAAIKELVEHGLSEQQTKVIPFCVDEELFCGLAPEPAPGELTLVMSARMFRGKGHMELLAALAKLSPRYPKLRAVFIGDGPTRPTVEAEIDRLNLRHTVECRGRVDHGQVPAIMRNAHVVVLPSYMEGETFPLCLMEGMALGLPAIGTRWSGIPEIIVDGKTGILVEPRDEIGLALAIERFLVEPAFYLSARRGALARVKSRYNATSVARTYSEQYEAALRE